MGRSLWGCGVGGQMVRPSLPTAAGDRPLGQGGWGAGAERSGWLRERGRMRRGQRDQKGEQRLPPRPLQAQPWPRAATWWGPRVQHRLGWDPPPQGVSHPTAHPCLPPPPQHYTTDADGLCTRLIKPKVMEGTVAAQDEFSRSEWPCPLPGSWGPPQHLLTLLSPPCRWLGPQHEGPQAAADHWQRGIWR